MPFQVFVVEAPGAKACVWARNASEAERAAWELTGLEAFRHPLVGRTHARGVPGARAEVLLAATQDLAQGWGA